VPPQPNSGDGNSGVLNNDGSFASLGNIAELAGQPREIQFALKFNW